MPRMTANGSHPLQAALALQVVERAADGVLVTDQRLPDQPIIYANPAFSRLTGYDQAEALGRNCRFLQADDRDQPEIAVLRETIAAGETAVITLRNYRRDGSLFWNEVRLAPLCLTPGAPPTHCVGFQRDVSALVRGEAELRQALHQAEDANATKRRFLAAMDHEFRTPIGIIMGFADLLGSAAEQGEAVPRQGQYLKDMRAAAHHLLTLVEDARRYMQVSEIDHLSKLLPLRLSGLLAQAADQAGPVLRDAGVSLRRVAPPGEAASEPEVLGDAVLLLQSLGSLLQDLARQAPEGSEVELRLEYRDRHAIIGMRCGRLVLPCAGLANLQDPFAADSDLYLRGLEGTGILFAVSGRVIGMHGGDLAIASDATEGTRIQVTLPLAPGATVLPAGI